MAKQPPASKPTKRAISLRLAGWAAWAVLLLAPLAYLLRLTARYGIKYPFWDEWDFVSIIHKYNAHTLKIADLWAQHNEHRIFFPNIIMLTLATHTHWNVRYELMTS